MTFPHPATDRQQPATDSDAWDPLSHIDHPGRVCTHIGTHTNTFLPSVHGIVPLSVTQTCAEILSVLFLRDVDAFPLKKPDSQANGIRVSLFRLHIGNSSLTASPLI